jgi:hypothetical protein
VVGVAAVASPCVSILGGRGAPDPGDGRVLYPRICAEHAEGPGADALAYGTTVAAPDLAGVAGRWPGFASAALDLGVGAVFAFPVHVGLIPVAAVLAHRAEPGALSASARRVARVLAAAAAAVLFRPSAFGPTPPQWMEQTPAAYPPEIDQATGMISVQLGVSMAEALTRMRACAQAHGRTAAQVALDVMERRLRFAP